MAMGAANVIPGVSGGTIAFITGIYERFIHSINSFNPKNFKRLLSGKFKTFSDQIDLPFLFAVFSGIAVSVISLSKVVTFAFAKYETLTLSFFFGLIVASLLAVARQMRLVNTGGFASFLVGTIIAIFMAFLPPAQPNNNFVYVLICGIAAICSMILPGLSGSYVLLLMGNYSLVIRAVGELDFSVLLPLLIGCVIGLVTLSRLLSYLFDQFKNQTISSLTGFVAGSLLLIWPWKTTLYQSFDGKLKAIGYLWEIPSMNIHFFMAFACMSIGFLLVFWIDRNAHT